MTRVTRQHALVKCNICGAGSDTLGLVYHLQCCKSEEKQHKRKRDGRRGPVVMKPLSTRVMVPIRGDLGNLTPRVAKFQWEEME